MSKWKYIETAFGNTSTTYQYTNVSITVPANQMYEIIALDRVGTSRPLGIIIADSSTSIDSTDVIIAENTYGTTGSRPWTLQVHCITPSIKTVDHTFYVWVKRESVGNNTILLAYRRIV